MTAILYLIIIALIIIISIQTAKVHYYKNRLQISFNKFIKWQDSNNKHLDHCRGKYRDSFNELAKQKKANLDMYNELDIKTLLIVKDRFTINTLRDELTQSNLERDLLAAKALELFHLNNDTNDELVELELEHYELQDRSNALHCANKDFERDYLMIRKSLDDALIENDLLADKALQLWFDNRVYHDQLNKALNRTDNSIGLNAIDYFIKHFKL